MTGRTHRWTRGGPAQVGGSRPASARRSELPPSWEPPVMPSGAVVARAVVAGAVQPAVRAVPVPVRAVPVIVTTVTQIASVTTRVATCVSMIHVTPRAPLLSAPLSSSRSTSLSSLSTLLAASLTLRPHTRTQTTGGVSHVSRIITEERGRAGRRTAAGTALPQRPSHHQHRSRHTAGASRRNTAAPLRATALQPEAGALKPAAPRPTDNTQRLSNRRQNWAATEVKRTLTSNRPRSEQPRASPRLASRAGSRPESAETLQRPAGSQT